MLIKIISSIRFLARQGLPLRGDGSEELDSNFYQMLKLKSEEDPRVNDWLKKKTNKYTSHDIQNEILKVVAMRVLRNIGNSLQSPPFITIMMDETTDASNREQVTLVFRSVSDKLDVNEDFLGLYTVPSIHSRILKEVMDDCLCRLNIPYSRVRGQCYDGASTMSGARSGVAKLIMDEEPRAVYTHCYGHSINLAVNDAIKHSKVILNALDTTHELTKLIKFSPRREEIFRELKKQHDLLNDYHSAGMRLLCPTRWTVRADALASIISNYEVLLKTWEEALDVAKDTEIKARINGVHAQMQTYEFLFATFLGEMVLRHSDNLSAAIQKKTTSAAEGQQLARLVITTLQRTRSAEAYDLFWSKVLKFAECAGIGEPQLPRRRKIPARLDEGGSNHFFHQTPKDHFRQIYYETIDNTTNCIANRFDQSGYKIYCNLEQLLIKASNQSDFEDELKFVCDFYKDDFNSDNLKAQLVTFGVEFQQKNVTSTGATSFFDLLDHFKAYSIAQRSLLDQVVRVVQLILVMPATNATSERSFSALRRIKDYLRATMKQERLNHLLVLHVHKELTDSFDLKDIASDFISGSDHRINIFGSFT